jgi:hypothetical protein
MERAMSTTASGEGVAPSRSMLNVPSFQKRSYGRTV